MYKKKNALIKTPYIGTVYKIWCTDIVLLATILATISISFNSILVFICLFF